jgi:hypothetical protein
VEVILPFSLKRSKTETFNLPSWKIDHRMSRLTGFLLTGTIKKFVVLGTIENEGRGRG